MSFSATTCYNILRKTFVPMDIKELSRRCVHVRECADCFSSLSDRIEYVVNNINWDHVGMVRAKGTHKSLDEIKDERRKHFAKSRALNKMFSGLIESLSDNADAVVDERGKMVAEVVSKLLVNDGCEVYTGKLVKNEKTMFFARPTFLVVDKVNKKITAVDVYKNEYGFSHEIKSEFYRSMKIDYKVMDNDCNFVGVEGGCSNYYYVKAMRGERLFKDTEEFMRHYGII